MPPIRRRRLLASMGALASGGLAGCSGLGGSQPLVLPPPPPELVSDYTVGKVRAAEPVALMFETGSSDEREPLSIEFVSTRSGLDAVAFNRDVRAGAELARYAKETDLEARSLLLLQEDVSACYRSRLVSVALGSGEIQLTFCRELRPADADCEVGSRTTLGYAIRLPPVAESISSFGLSHGRDCPQWAAEGRHVTVLVDATGGDGGNGGD
ncbi:MAG: hypothetical protein ABEI31_10990 [Halodesulfurarchaeum sp.]